MLKILDIKNVCFLRVNNLQTLAIENAKSLKHYVYMNLSIWKILKLFL